MRDLGKIYPSKPTGTQNSKRTITRIITEFKEFKEDTKKQLDKIKENKCMSN